MTSNLGSKALLEGNKGEAQELLAHTFKPEFLNRIDEIVYFNPLGKEAQKKIVDKMLQELSTRLVEGHYLITFSDALKDWILDESYNEEFGARPIKRFIQDQVETYLAEQIIKGALPIDHDMILDRDGEKLVIKPVL